MARLFAIAFLVGLLPSGLAGPACAQKFKDTSDCIQKCSTKWGFPGLMMGNDPWGSVMQTTGKTIDDFYLVVAQACGEQNTSSTTAESSSSSATAEATQIIHQGLGTQAVSSSSATPTSTSSRFITSTRLTTSSTTHSTTKSSTSTKPTTTTTSTKPRTTSTSTHTTAQAVKTNGLANTGNSNSNSGSSSNSNSNSGNSNSNSGNSNSNSDSSSSSSNSNTGTSSNTGSSGSSSSGGNGSRASDSDVQAYLKAHNTIRSDHGAVPVTWSNAAAEKAQQWADLCKNQHSGGTLGPLGENLAAGTGTYTIAEAVKDWTDEVSEYNSNNPQPSHFSQVVWKATTQIGCAVQTCDGIFAGFGPAQYYVCEYSVQGNVIGEFGQNVEA